MVAAKEVALSCLCERLRVLPRVCVNGSEAAPTTIADIIELTREGVEAKRKNALLSARNTDIEAKLEEF